MNRILIASLVAAMVAAIGIGRAAAGGEAASFETAQARTVTDRTSSGFDAAVEAVRQTVVAAQVTGAIVAVEVEAGQRVETGTILVRIDARAAGQAAAARDATVQAARAAFDLAEKEFVRQQQLASRRYISQAALERARAQYESARAQLRAESAQAAAATTQAGFHIVRAPYAGVVAEVPITVGDMAMPGRPLLVLYDPANLRVAAAVPETVALRARDELVRSARIEIPGSSTDHRALTPTEATVLPVVDPATHTVTLRLQLPAGLEGLAPGMFARVWLPMSHEASERVVVPATAIVRRAELTGLYVIGGADRPILRQVRIGRASGDEVEILSGVAPGERVVVDPLSLAGSR